MARNKSKLGQSGRSGELTFVELLLNKADLCWALAVCQVLCLAWSISLNLQAGAITLYRFVRSCSQKRAWGVSQAVWLLLSHLCWSSCSPLPITLLMSKVSSLSTSECHRMDPWEAKALRNRSVLIWWKKKPKLNEGKSHCHTVRQLQSPAWTPGLPFLGLGTLSTWLTDRREASCCEKHQIHSAVSSRKNSQALGGQDRASTTA